MNLRSDGICLPAFSISGQINQLLANHNRLIITAAPGAGKSTLLPLTILDAFPEQGKILMLEPRRMATKHIAERMAYLINETVGETVGYRVRFEKKISDKTRIEVLTEGILTRMITNDPTLEGVSTILFDEFHERSLTSDVALTLAREIQQIIRPDLRLVIMSATIDASALASALQAPVVECEGKMFPVHILHSEEDATATNVVELVSHYIRKAHAELAGDILAFLPGQAEILRCQELLSNALEDTQIYPLYGLLSPQEQQRAIAPSSGHTRKVVLATPIAETSLTIEGVKIVIDSGLYRTLVFDQRNGLSHLETQRISLDMATQRSGRAGRLSSGTCYRLWTLATEHRMKEGRDPEIINADLASTLLNISVWGESNVYHLPWITPPPSSNVEQGYQLLTLLKALDNNKKATKLGTTMSELPCHPRISKMLLTEKSNHHKAIAADIAAIIEEKDPFERDNDADINSRIVSLRKARSRNEEGRWSRIINIAKEYRTLDHIKEENDIPSPHTVGALIASAYPERIAVSVDDCGRYKMANGNTAFLPQDDTLTSCKWLSIAAINASSGRIFLASPLDINDIQHLITIRDNISWDSKRGCVIAQQEKRIGALILQTKELNNVDQQAIVKVISTAAIKEGLSMFNFTEAVANLQRRIAMVATWHPELNIPSLNTESLLSRTKEWLPFFIQNNGTVMTTVNELKKINLQSVIESLLTYEQLQEINRLAPTHIVVPTGSRIKVDYRQGSDIPVLCVRLQECFGLTNTPCVNDGQQPVLMELLSPGFKPVQLTQDLKSFWNNTYFEVRKDLKRRYPKHYWPDNPLEAEAVRGVNKKAK